jgi:hypothetical protein
VNQIQTTSAAPLPGRLGQGTAVEQSRAVAEVQAAIVVAQQCPRNVQAALADMQASCKQTALAERAFYRFPRAGGAVTGASVHLARELARCWGNVQYGIAELRRDDEFGQSEMSAFAWDVQTNTRNSSTFVVPHKRDTKDGAKTLTEMRDIYENNANNGARRVREAIFAILPPWFVEEAKALCNQTLRDGGGVPLPQRIAEAIKAFDALGVVADRIEQKVGRPSTRWTEHDVAQLHVTYTSLQRGEITADVEFPAERVTAAEVTRPTAPRAEQPAAVAEPEDIWVRVANAADARGWDQEQAEREFAKWSGGEAMGPASTEQLERFITHISGATAS